MGDILQKRQILSMGYKEHGCPRARFRYRGIRKRSPERIGFCDAAVLQSKKRKRLKVRGWSQKVRMSNFEVQNPNDK
jgi:hypothetical protein